MLDDQAYKWKGLFPIILKHLKIIKHSRKKDKFVGISNKMELSAKEILTFWLGFMAKN